MTLKFHLFYVDLKRKPKKKKNIGNCSPRGWRGRNTASDDLADCVKTIKFKISSPLMSSLILIYFTQWEEQISQKKKKV